MQDKDNDAFFEEEKQGNADEQQLLNMIDKHDKTVTAQFKAGQKVSGKVQSVGSEFVFVDIGAKNEAMIKRTELSDSEGNVTVNPGDTVEAYVVSADEEELVLSKSLSGRKADLDELVNAKENGLPVEGRITGVNKGGFNVNIMGRRAFCPMSSIELHYVDDPNQYLSRTMDFVISRIEERGRNIVLTRLPLLEDQLESRLAEIEEAAGSKQVFAGRITKIADFGLFVDLGGVEGLVHISEVSWDRTDNLAAHYSAGDKIECVVLKVERKKRIRDTRISLSIRHVYEDPWKNVSEKFSPGQSVRGRITRLTNFGAFVQLEPGIEGLIHVSEMSWTRRVKHPSEVVSEGDTVNVTILAVDESKHSVSCSLKDVAEDPWREIDERFPEGSSATGTVASETRYGFFIDLADGVTGLLPHRNVAADRKGSIKVGEPLEVGIESVDTESRRISLTYGVSEKKADERSAKEYMKKQSKETRSSSEFGDLLKQALEKKE